MYQHFNIRELLEDLGYTQLTELPKEYRTSALYRSGDNKSALSIKKDTGFWIDYVLGMSGTFPELVKLTLKLESVDEAQQWLKGKNVNFTVQAQKPIKQVAAPKIYNNDLLIKLHKDYVYWINRGISKSVLEKFKGGMVYAGKMAGRFVFPIFNGKKQIVGFTGRDTYNNSNRPKWKHIGSTSDWVYPAHLNVKIIQEKKTVILVESIGDCLALYNMGIDYSLVTFGLNLSSAIINFLIKTDVRCIIIALNNDGSLTSPGNKAALKMKEKLSHYFDADKIEIALPDKKDFGEMTVEEIKLWNSKRPCQPLV